MKLLRQFLIIAVISVIGELLHSLLPLPVPASIYGLLLLLLALSLHIIHPKHIERAAQWLLEIMPVMFVPAAVGLMDVSGALGSRLWVILLICVLSTVIVMGVSGLCTQLLLHRKKEGQEEDA